MSNIKKIIGVVLALVMALSVATVAFAVDNNSEAAYTVTISSDKTELAAGESATVTVYLTTNFYASAISIPVFFDNSQVTVSAGSTTIADASIATETSADSAKLYAGSGYTQADHGVRALLYIAEYGSTIATYNNTAVMTFTVTANEAATGSVTVECSTGSLKSASNSTGALYVAKDEANDDDIMDDTAYNVTNATITGATATINFAAVGGDPELILTATGEDYGTVIDRVTDCNNYDGYVYGIDTINDGEDILDFVTTEFGSVEVETNDYDEMSTGALIYLKNADGDVVETYVFIYFGDVNGDALVDYDDSGAIEGSVAMIADEIEYGTPAYIASDLNGDGMIDYDDSGAIESAVAMIDDFLTQYEYAQQYAENNL